MDAIEFDCCDCGRHVIAFGRQGPDLERCTTCFWIAENIPPEEQAAVRERLGVALEPTEVREVLDLDALFPSAKASYRT